MGDETETEGPGVLEASGLAAIREALVVTEVSQSELARRVGVTPAAVSNALAGHSARGMSLGRLERWMGALGWSVELSSSYVGPAVGS